MHKTSRLFLWVALAALLIFNLGASAHAQAPVELRFTWYNDGVEGQVLRGLLDQFEAKNPDIKVVVDTVAFKDLHATLSAQVEVDKGPDLARETEPQRYYGKLLDLTSYLSDPKSFSTVYSAALLNVLAGTQGGITGYPLDFTSSGPFVNVSLFKKANVAIPSDTNAKVSWTEWVEVAKKVRDATGVPYTVAIDRSGHRWFSSVLEYGGTFFDKDGKFTIDTPAFRKAAEMLIGWHKDGLAPLEVWAGGGSGYAAAADFFINQQVPLYYSGSWQVSNFDKVIADKFEWKAVPNPCDVTCTGMPGGGFVIAFKSSQHPKEVARVIDFLTSKDIAGKFAVDSRLLPARLDLAKDGLTYPTRATDLSTFLKAVTLTSDEAFRLQNHPLIQAVNVETRDRLSQVIVGEITLDDAIKKIQAKMDDLQAGKK